MVKKINITVTQLIAFDLFLGYQSTNWNPRTNFFLIGKYKKSNIFNINYTYSLSKKFFNFISDLINKKCRIWLVNENFDIFNKSVEFSRLSAVLNELSFINSKWYKGSLSNYKFVGVFKPNRFPHAIFVPNMVNNHFAINESFLINIPSWGLSDSIDNPLNIFFPIPGNSKSIKSVLFFYMLSSKSVLYSRYISASSFLFSSFKKHKRLVFNKALSSLLVSTYFARLKKGYLFKRFIPLLNSFLLFKKQFSFTLKKKIKFSRKRKILKWKFPLLLISVIFSNLLYFNLLDKLNKKIIITIYKSLTFKALSRCFNLIF